MVRDERRPATHRGNGPAMLWAIRHEPKAGVPTMGVGRLHVLLILLAS